MMEKPIQATEFPPELAERLYRLAAAEMSESRPWPGVDKAVRRLHRRRLAGVSAVAATCAVIIGVTFSGALGLSSDRGQHAPPAGPQPSATRTVKAGPPLASGYAGPVGGSLAGDQTWLKEVRARVIVLAAADARSASARNFLSRAGAADQVQVLWASDLDSFRYAFVVYRIDVPKSKKPVYTSALLSGPAGARADQLSFRVESKPGTPINAKSGTPAEDPTRALFLATRSANAVPDLLLVCAPPTVTNVEVASTRTFTAGSQNARTQYRPLSREGGSVWVGKINPGEAYLSDLQLTGRDGYSINKSPQNSFSPEEQAVVVAPAGSDLTAVRSAGSALAELGPSIEEKAVLSTSSQFSSTGTLAATVFRSPEGVALVGFAEYDRKYPARSSRHDWSGYWIAKQPLGDPDTFMTASVWQQDQSAGYVVLTPVGATSARIGKVTVPVHNRLARFELGDYHSSFSVQALNAQGKVMATVKVEAEE
jgi:hypothetical protein